ncbi:phosphoenolpyruvate--protein phosphotransferase [Ferrimonas lipolytica]|uniref:phosphoenolpyruvate--protein phosphotransferase n=1 Tax=Ferrimonas lipolytica TaxID=2724191 RepID=A0A6H1UGR5_9GAMM|nr:phosphoenolpyruvate--protein phosphotransferase [Ferrimonas lipolytica]QIZ77513.1 phosphoenolpyruvate--protein phosphotransferase [Ferrimonas lipolytica]
MINTLRQIVQQVSQAETVEQSVTELVNLTRSALNTDCCSLYLVDEQGLLLVASNGLAADAVGRSRLALGQGVVGTVASREELINLANAPSHPAFVRLPEANEDDYRAFLAVPLVHRAVTVGVLVVQQRIARQFSEEEESFLITLASQISPQIHQRALASKNGESRYCYSGLSASSGIAIAPALVVKPQESLQQPEQLSVEPDLEWPRLQQAIDATMVDLDALMLRLDNGVADDVRMVFDSYQMLLGDPELLRSFEAQCEQGWSAETAVCRVMKQAMNRFASMTDEYLRERASDIQDLAQRILKQLSASSDQVSEVNGPMILVATDITATMLLEYGGEQLQGLISIRGGVNSHTAILARAMGIPAIVALEGITVEQLDGQQLLLDALKGQVWINPEAEQVARFERSKQQRDRFQAVMQEHLSQPCVSQDGQAVQLMLNADAGSVEQLMSQDGVSGVGLYRTEALFMASDRFPSEQQQRRHYHFMLEQAKGKPVVIRTLDVGGDKPLPYMPIREDNPFLGWRGIRLCLDHPELFIGQLRAMLSANADFDNLKILIPMVARLDEIHQCQRLMHQALAELVEELDRPLPIPQLGIMIEVPAALMQLPKWLEQVDFVSVGSNDLTQYILAVDRNNERVGQQFDSYHPAVVQALAQVADSCKNHSFSLCGELAGETQGALMLLALGYRELSMNGPSLGPIHYLVRNLDLLQLADLKQGLLDARDSHEVRQLLHNHLHQSGLDNLEQF